ncbi:MAG: toluene hydroxylase [Kyrpidia sp.]|nr:toluene hydroxylase [Kyrpidia sp.]
MAQAEQTEQRVRTAEAGAFKFAGSEDRRFVYFQPRKRRPTTYEDVTIDIQPYEGRYLKQGFLMRMLDASPNYTEERTRLRCSDWNRIIDVNEEYERVFYQRQQAVEEQFRRTLNAAKSRQVFETFDPAWVRVLENHLSAFKHAEYGLGMHSFAVMQREALTIMLNNIFTVQSAEKLRFAQDLTIYMMELAEQIRGFDEGRGREAWLSAPEWQGVRKTVEHINAAADWGEQWFAVNLLYEPLVGELFRSRFIMLFGAQNGDFVTPVLVSTAEADYDRNLRTTVEAFKVLLADDRHGAANRARVDEWVKQYLPLCIEAAKGLEPLWEMPKVQVAAFSDSYERAAGKCLHSLGALGITLPKGVRV